MLGYYVRIIRPLEEKLSPPRTECSRKMDGYFISTLRVREILQMIERVNQGGRRPMNYTTQMRRDKMEQ